MALDESVDVPPLKVIATACLVTWFNPQALIDGALMLGAFKASLPPGQDMSLGYQQAFRTLVFGDIYHYFAVQRENY